jgi:hypothetical protein
MEPEQTTDEEVTAQSRRQFLKGAGAVGASAVVGSLAADTAAQASQGGGPGAAAARGRAANQLGAPKSPEDFGRIFPKLKPFAEANDTVRAALVEVGKPGGIMDAGDRLDASPKALIIDPALNGNPTVEPPNPYGTNPDNPTMTAGSTFVGQFIDHDVTFDQTSALGVPQDPLISRNTRTPALDLDSVFGGGPGGRPELFERNDDGSLSPKMKIGTGGVHEDVPRVANGDGSYTALLADPRNDENMMISGLVTATILFYNRVLDEMSDFDVRAFPASGGARTLQGYEAFLLARQVTLWHHQWLVVNEHLPQIVGQAMVDDILRNGNRFYRPPAGDAFMPIEFGGAAYRFGHSMVRPSYRANFSSGTGPSPDPAKAPFFGLVFDPAEPNFHEPVTHDRNDLLGGFPAPRRYIGWQTFFDFGDGQVKPNKKIDPAISSELFTLPLTALAPHTQTAPVVLAQRNLLRQLTWGLPSGQDIAHAMDVPALTSGDLADIAGVYTPFGKRTPLWYYVLAEAKVAAKGLNLGPVGGRIVAETLIGLLQADETSYLAVNPGFRPFLGADMSMGPNVNANITGSRAYTHAHYLNYARVVEPGLYR